MDDHFNELAEKLERACAGYSNGRTSMDVELILQAADTLRKQAEELERCRTALRPFAKAGELFPPRPADSYNECVYGPVAGREYNITGDDLRLACSAYNEPKQNGEAK